MRSLILESYRLIAPKRTLAKLEAEGASPGPGRKPIKKGTLRKAGARKPRARKRR